MEQERIEEGLQHCLLLDDFDFFKVIVNHLKEEKPCLAALYLARGFGLDWEERYNKYFKLAVEANPEWATAIDEMYGQPLFREIFAVGANDCLDAYLNAVGKKNKDFLQYLYQFAVSWNEDLFNGTALLPEKYPFEIFKGEQRTILIGSNEDFEWINDLVRRHDILARQRMMLFKLDSLL